MSTLRLTRKSAFFALILSVAVNLQGCGEPEKTDADNLFGKQEREAMEANLTVAAYTDCFKAQKKCIEDHAADINEARKTALLAFKDAANRKDEALLKKTTWAETKEDPVGCLFPQVQLNQMFAKAPGTEEKDKGGCSLKFSEDFLEMKCDAEAAATPDTPKTDAEKAAEAAKTGSSATDTAFHAEQAAKKDDLVKAAEAEEAKKNAAAQTGGEQSTETPVDKNAEDTAEAEDDEAQLNEENDNAGATQTDVAGGASLEKEDPELVSLMEKGKVTETGLATIGAHSFLQKL